MNKNALLICGEFRNQNNILLLNKFITDDMDVFVSTWNNYGKRHTSSNLKTIEERYSNNKYSNLSVKNDLLKIKNIKVINTEKIKSYDNYFSIHSSIIKKCGNQYSPIGTAYNIYHMNKSLQLLKEYEIKNNIKYKNIIKTRPDLLINFKFQNNYISDDSIYFSLNTSHNYSRSDKLFFGSRDVIFNFIIKMKQYAENIWKSDCSNISDNNLPIGERLMFQIIVYFKLKNKIIRDNCFIIR